VGEIAAQEPRDNKRESPKQNTIGLAGGSKSKRERISLKQKSDPDGEIITWKEKEGKGGWAHDPEAEGKSGEFHKGSAKRIRRP